MPRQKSTQTGQYHRSPGGGWWPTVVALLVVTAVVPGVAAAAPAHYGDSVGAVSSEWEPGPERYGVEIEDDIPVEMSDGATLRVAIVYPIDLSCARGDRVPSTWPCGTANGIVHRRE